MTAAGNPTSLTPGGDERQALIAFWVVLFYVRLRVLVAEDNGGIA